MPVSESLEKRIGLDRRSHLADRVQGHRVKEPVDRLQFDSDEVVGDFSRPGFNSQHLHQGTLTV
jgi:hypothetical protein